MTSIEYSPVSADAPVPPVSAVTRLGELLFVSDTPGYYARGQIDEGDFSKQFDRAVVNLREILNRGGSSLRSVLKVSILLTRVGNVQEMNELYARVFGPGAFPARTT